jgi:dihydrofolate reductase
VKAIAAMSLNRVIGAQGKIPWRLSEDLKFFKRTTLGHVILMGRKTYESLGKPLPGRENWVVSSRSIPGVRVIHDLREIAEPGGGRELFLIGGAQLYGELMQKCSELFLTLVKRKVAGDTFFPPFESTFRLEEVVFESLEMEIRRYGRLPGRQAIAPGPFGNFFRHFARYWRAPNCRIFGKWCRPSSLSSEPCRQFGRLEI